MRNRSTGQASSNSRSRYNPLYISPAGPVSVVRRWDAKGKRLPDQRPTYFDEFTKTVYELKE